MITEFIEMIKKLAPEIVAVIINYYKTRKIEAENKQKEAELKLKLIENHEKVDRDNSGKSDANIVDDASKGSKQ